MKQMDSHLDTLIREMKEEMRHYGIVDRTGILCLSRKDFILMVQMACGFTS